MINPIIRREARVALRNWRFFAAITVYVSLILLCVGSALYSMIFYSYNLTFDPSQALMIYTLLCSIQFGLVILATPALTAGSISGERERQTLDLLLATRMSAFSIVMGKLLSSLSQLLLLLVSSMPVFAVVFYFGGISLGAFAAVMGYTLLTACMAGAISLFFSCLFKRTVLSVLMVYLIFGALCLGTLIAVLAQRSFYYQMNDVEPSIWGSLVTLALNPAAGFASVLSGQAGYDVAMIMGIGGNPTTMELWAMNHFYLFNIGAQVLLTALFIWLSTRFIYPRTRSKKRG